MTTISFVSRIAIFVWVSSKFYYFFCTEKKTYFKIMFFSSKFGQCFKRRHRYCRLCVRWTSFHSLTLSLTFVRIFWMELIWLVDEAKTSSKWSSKRARWEENRTCGGATETCVLKLGRKSRFQSIARRFLEAIAKNVGVWDRRCLRNVLFASRELRCVARCEKLRK